MKRETIAIHAGYDGDPTTKAVAVPIYQTIAFEFDSANALLQGRLYGLRRAERLVVSDPVDGSLVGRYLNRLSDLLWAMARWTEGEDHLLARGAKPRRRGGARARTASRRDGQSRQDEQSAQDG